MKLESAEEAKKLSAMLQSEGKSVGFVPTMGALHDGHSSLIRRSVEENPATIVSIFVNPTQFGPNEDLDKYPRTPEKDIPLLEELGVTAVFMPSRTEMYPETQSEIEFRMPRLGKILCAASRPGHFEGVLQVVSRLFNIVKPNRAYFGRKDYQQLQAIKFMVRELFMDLEVIGCPIIRETDGLAMSSRNVYLNEEERQQALGLSAALNAAKAKWLESRDITSVKMKAQSKLAEYPLVRKDYLEFMNQDLSPIENDQPNGDPIGLVAAFLGATRLIDNMVLSENQPT